MNTTGNIFRKPGTDRGAVLSPSAKCPGMWQMSTFDARGFSGDYQWPTEEEARAEALGDGYTEPMDPAEFAALAVSERFQAGCEITYLINKTGRTLKEEIRFYQLCAIINGTQVPEDHEERVAALYRKSH